MAKIIPFKAVRAPRDKVSLVSSRSYINYSKKKLKEKLNFNPYTFLHILHPNFPNEKQESLQDKYKKVRKHYEYFIKEKILIKDSQESFYIYRQIKDGYSYTGLIAGVSVEDYQKGLVKMHEDILSHRRELFTKYLKYTRINAEPVLLSYSGNAQIKGILQKYTVFRAEYEFTTTDKVAHYLWIVKDIRDIQLLQQNFKNIKNLYIADGHHRTASSALFADTFNAPKNSILHKYFMAFLLEEKQINITSYHRLIKSLNGHTKDTFLRDLKKNFQIKSIQKKIPVLKPKTLAMYLQKDWYEIEVRPGTFEDTLTGSLDSDILSKNILSSILKIKDIKTSKQVDFTEDVAQLQKQVDNGLFAVGFCFYSIDFQSVKKIADNKLNMPPKSTWIKPKLRSGLLIYPLCEE